MWPRAEAARSVWLPGHRIPVRLRLWSGQGSRFAHRHTKAGQKQLAVRGAAELGGARYEVRSKAPQPGDDRARFIEPPHMDIASSENTVRVRITRIFLNGHEQLRCRFVKLAFEEMSFADQAQRRTHSLARA